MLCSYRIPKSRVYDLSSGALIIILSRYVFLCFFSDRAIPSANIDLHYAHCSRNLERCKICCDMVPKTLAEEHYLNTHAPVWKLLSSFA